MNDFKTLFLTLVIVAPSLLVATIEIPFGKENALKNKAFTGAKSDRQATVRLWRDKRNLNVALWAEHPSMENREAHATEHDEPVHRDDCLEVFIDAAGRKKAYYQVVANVNGAIFDLRKDDLGRVYRNWDSGAIAKGRYGKEDYEISISIPLSSLNLGENPSHEIGLAVGSYVRHNLDACSAWGEYHKPASWQRFILPGEYPVVLKSFRNSGGSGTQPFEVTLQNISDQPIELTGLFNGQPIERIKLAIGETVASKFSATHPADEPTANILILNDDEHEVLRVTRIFTPVQLLQAMPASPLRYTHDSLRIHGRVNEPPDAPLEILVHTDSGKTIAYSSIPEQVFAITLPPQPAKQIECRYKSEIVSFDVETIRSPWEE